MDAGPADAGSLLGIPPGKAFSLEALGQAVRDIPSGPTPPLVPGALRRPGRLARSFWDGGGGGGRSPLAPSQGVPLRRTLHLSSPRICDVR